ncbi:ceramide kinase isoform X2 [Latimeria chalumnae]|uniref:Ceramide kinase n=1 Tax=Latimeria chalumnae TaxID=7897 RepID=H3ATN9_LATCH|nr:PREDICTED: ceramide kinase isoform X2 [Latimeria chalumnae]|eukprot:XP_006004505.1 PREDICTED: ceramide kinase isoform X2 [Latimeria chalumnae]
MENQRRVLVSRFLVKNRLFEVTLEPAALSWTEVRPRKSTKGGFTSSVRTGFCLTKMLHRARGLAGRLTEHFNPVARSVPLSEIITVREPEVDGKSRGGGQWQKMAKFSHDPDIYAFTVYYVIRVPQHRWRCCEVTFCCRDELLFNQWMQALKEYLELQTCRPKHLLVYINPSGGKKRGKQIYEQKVSPLFSLASITTDVIVTEHVNHARDHLFDIDLKKYDGVICVGGDGMFSEIVHGLVGRTQKDCEVDQNTPTARLVPCNIRIGIIPAGSTDCICYATVGINDPVTSALHIIVGDSQPLDVCSVHHNNTFLRYSVSLLGYGFYGDILTVSEKNRWMGPRRYDFSGFKTFLSHHYYEGTVSLLPATGTLGSPRDNSRCRTGCYVCQQSGQQNSVSQKKQQCNGIEDGEDEERWQVIRGKFLAINAASMSCACPRSPKGLSPSAHLADGTTDLILVRKCSRLNFLRHLVRHKSKHDQFDLGFVEVHRVKKFSFTPRQFEEEDGGDTRDAGKKHFGQFCRDHPTCGCCTVNSAWNCDGEILDHTAIEVRVHCQLVKLFTRGIEGNTVPGNVGVPCAI